MGEGNSGEGDLGGGTGSSSGVWEEGTYVGDLAREVVDIWLISDIQ